MNIKSSFYFFVAAVVLCGCAPMAVDLSGSDNLVNRQVQKSDQFDYKLVVLNKAPETTTKNILFGTGIHPINFTAEKPKDTLERDIKRYFGKITSRVDNERRVVVRIDRADAYYEGRASKQIPFIGLFTVWIPNTLYVFDINVYFEVEENGKVIRSWPFTQKVEFHEGETATPSGLERSYQQLISMYRKSMFDSLNEEFIPRYLSKPIITTPISRN